MWRSGRDGVRQVPKEVLGSRLPLQRPWLEEEQEAREAGDRICWACKLIVRIHLSFKDEWELLEGLNRGIRQEFPHYLATSSSSSNSSALFPIHLSWGFCGKAILFLGWLTPVLNVSHCYLIRIASTFHPCLYKVHSGIPDHPDLLNVIINPSTLFLMDHHLFFFCYLWTWKTFFSSLSPLSHSLSHSFIQ